MQEHDLTIASARLARARRTSGVGMAVSLLRHNAGQKIVLCRPAVEAGERLGSCPAT